MTTNDTRTRMIDTAIRMFQEHGYHGVSWRKLVKEAGTPWGSIAHHFPGGKIELALAAVDAGANAVNDLIQYCFSKESGAAKAVKMWFHLTAKHMEKLQYQTGCPVASIALSTTPMVPEISEASFKAFDRWELTLAELMSTKNAPDKRVAEVAKIVVTLLEGGIVRARIAHSTTPLERAGEEAFLIVEREVG